MARCLTVAVVFFMTIPGLAVGLIGLVDLDTGQVLITRAGRLPEAGT